MKALTLAIGALRRFNQVLHLVAGAMLLGILAVTVLNIFGRQIGTPLAGSVEMTAMFMGLMVFLALSFGEDERVHITVDLLYERLGSTGQRVLRLFGRAVAIAVTALMVVQMWKYANSIETAGQTTPVREWPVHLFIRIGSFGAFMLLLSTIANFLADLFNIEGYAEEDGSEPDLESAI